MCSRTPQDGIHDVDPIHPHSNRTPSVVYLDQQEGRGDGMRCTRRYDVFPIIAYDYACGLARTNCPSRYRRRMLVNSLVLISKGYDVWIDRQIAKEKAYEKRMILGEVIG